MPELLEQGGQAGQTGGAIAGTLATIQRAQALAGDSIGMSLSVFKQIRGRA
jgi:hypothetical protein